MIVEFNTHARGGEEEKEEKANWGGRTQVHMYDTLITFSPEI